MNVWKFEMDWFARAGSLDPAPGQYIYLPPSLLLKFSSEIESFATELAGCLVSSVFTASFQFLQAR